MEFSPDGKSMKLIFTVPDTEEIVFRASLAVNESSIITSSFEMINS